MRRLQNYFFLLLLCFFSLQGFHAVAQDDGGKSSVVKTIDGKKYYIHTVEKKQSLYAVSKIYNITLDLLCAENPEAIDGIKAGDVLKIPVKQEPVNTVTSPDDTDKYILHKVEKKETVYGIGKKYNLTEEQLRSLNPELQNGLKEGQLLKVGLKNATTPTTVTTGTAVTNSRYKGDSSYTWHVVKDQETYYAIARSYNTTPEALMKLNEGIATLKAGQKIRVKERALNETTQNLINAYETQVGNSIYINDTIRGPMRPKKTKYNLGIFLPVSTTRLEMERLDHILETKKDFPRMSTYAADFYEGYTYALDSLRSGDFEINTKVFDVSEKDSARMQSILSSNDFKTLDLIIGPWFTGAFQTVATAARDLGIPCISPTVSHNKILFQNPLASKLLPSKNYLLESLAKFAADSLRNANLMIVNNDKPKEQSVVRSFKTAYSDYLKAKYNLTDTLREVKGIAGLKSQFSDSKQNVVILLTENTVYLTEFFTQLGVFLGDKKEITMIGNSSWMNIQNLDAGYYNRYNFICSVPFFIDLNDPCVAALWNKYRNNFYSDPDEIFFQGYDLSFYLLNQLKKEGPDFWTKLSSSSAKGCVIDFNFYSPDENTGAENRSAKILKVKDYKLVKVN